MKLTPELLKRIVLEEAAKFGKMKDVTDAPKDTEEVEADGYADTLDMKIDHMKALKIKEDRLKAQINRLREKRERIKAMIIDKL